MSAEDGDKPLCYIRKLSSSEIPAIMGFAPLETYNVPAYKKLVKYFLNITSLFVVAKLALPLMPSKLGHYIYNDTGFTKLLYF